MGEHQKVVVYLRAGDVRLLKERQVENIPAWVRSQVKVALAMERQLPEAIGAPPIPIPPSAWQTSEAVEEVVAATTPPVGLAVVPPTSPAASTAKCRKEAMHHIYHAGKPCPVCGFPNREGS